MEAVLARSPEAVFITDARGSCVTVNARWCELTGASVEGSLADGWMTLVHPDDSAEFIGEWWRAVERGESFSHELRITRPDGTEGAMHFSAEPVPDDVGRTLAWMGRVQLDNDHDSTWVATRPIDDSRRFEQAFDNSPIGMALTTLEGDYVQVNAAMCELLHRSADELLSTSVLDTTHPDDLPQTVEAAVELLEGTTPSFSLEKRFLTADRQPIWTRATTTVLRDDSGVPRHFLTQLENIEERRQLIEQLHQVAIHDPLTGLANRAGLDEYMDTLDPTCRVGVIALDLDRFKAVNDTLGHHVGDEVLRTVADRIVQSVRRSDHAARMGCDEFLLLCSAARSDQDLLAVADRLGRRIKRPIEVGDATVSIGASVGVAAGLASELSDLRIRADEACYNAKRSGGAVVAGSP